MAMVATVTAFHSHDIPSIVVHGRSALPVFSAAKTDRKGRGRLRVVGEQCEEVAESRAKGRSREILLCSIAPYPLLLASALPGAVAVRSIFEPFVELVKTWNLPDWLVHWGHPGNMAVVLFAMGGYGTYLGFRIRLSKDTLTNVSSPVRSKSLNLAFTGALALGFTLGGVGIVDAKVGVNRPEMLPKEFSPVIDVAGFLSANQERQLCQEIADLEKDTGVKLRILAQNYPETPGAAVKEFWKVDDQTIVFVADPTFGNMLHFNVGASVDLDVPRSFWSRVAGKYGNMFYWKEKGEDASIEAAVVAISSCLRESTGPSNCLEVN